MAILATCRTLAGEVADEWFRGSCRPTTGLSGRVGQGRLL